MFGWFKKAKHKHGKNNSVAIIGTAGFFPESNSVHDFWSKLKNQSSFIKEIPGDHDPAEQFRLKTGAYIDDLKGFDATLFHIISAEAKYMTPQQRLLLMSVWNLFEDACILPSSLINQRVGVIVGTEVNPYTEYLNHSQVTAYTNYGLFETYLPNRISHYFKFKGPSYCVDTSCSSGLTALHHAKQMLNNHEVDYVVVAGINLIFGKEWTNLFYSATELMGLLTTDRETCYPFQNQATGFISSEGVITFLLKRGEEALIDRDNIQAFIIGSASNHSGGVGNIAFPDAKEQSNAIVAANKEAGIDPATITLIEAHAASSILADTEEIKAFKLADKQLSNDLNSKFEYPCKISTLKPNIGHMHAASGLASLLRLIYSFKDQKKLGIKDFSDLSSKINLDKTRYYISAATEEWPRLVDQYQREIPRRGAVNNYGAGGNNVHVILEEYVHKQSETQTEPSSSEIFFLALSSLDEEALVTYVKNIMSFFEKNNSCDVQQIECIYLMSRKVLDCRVVFRYQSIESLKCKLAEFIDSEGENGFYSKGSVKDYAWLNELICKNDKVVQFLNDLNGKDVKSFLFDLWSKGYEDPVLRYFKNRIVNKTSLPGYPFKRHSYWLDIYSEQHIKKEIIQNTDSDITSPHIHPLIHCAKEKYHYKSSFTGNEPFLKDHIVNGKKILPAVAYLEMARAALADTVALGQNVIVTFADVMWLQPFILDVEINQLNTILYKQNENSYNFEIISSNTQYGQYVVHSKGSIKTFQDSPGSYQYDPISIDKSTFEIELNHKSIYRILKSIGFDYGVSHQGLVFVKYNDKQVLGKVELSNEPNLDQSYFIISPGILDAALQAIVILDRHLGEKRMMLPFSLDYMIILKPLKSRIQIVAGYEENESGSELQRLYCDVFDIAGELLVKLKGFVRFPYDNKNIKKNKIDENSSSNEQLVLRNIKHLSERVYTLKNTIETKNNSDESDSKVIELVQIRNVLRTELASILDIAVDMVNTDTKFMDMGVDSMGGVEWVRLINQRYRLSISPIKIYDYPTIERFSQFVINELFKISKNSNNKHFFVEQTNAFTKIKDSTPQNIQTIAQDVMFADSDVTSIQQSLTPLLRESDRNMIERCSIKPDHLGSQIFQQRYHCKWSYYIGAMYRGIASEELVVKCAHSNILSIFGYMRLPFEEVDKILTSINRVVQSKYFGVGFSPSAFTGDSSAIDMEFVNLYIKHKVQVIELSAHIDVSKEIVYIRSKGLTMDQQRIVRPRWLIGKLSRLELAKIFMSPPPEEMLQQLIQDELISPYEAKIARFLPLCDDIVFEGNSGGYTDQQPFLTSFPSFVTLRNSMMEQYHYPDPILIGYGGGLGTPSAIAAAYMMGADFVLTGSINQCTVESGMSAPSKELLEGADIYDFGITTHGYALKYGFKIQALTKGTKFVDNSNYLVHLWNTYNSLDEIPRLAIKRIETILGHTLKEVWNLVVEYKRKHNFVQIEQAMKDPRLKMTLIFIWYYAFTQKVTLRGDKNFIGHYQIHSGPAIGAFNQFVKGSKYEKWQNRHVDEIASLLMTYACPIFNEKLFGVSLKDGTQTLISQSNVTDVTDDLGHRDIQAAQKINKPRSLLNQAIAVIGVAGRFPKSNNVLDFWKNIKNGIDCIEKIPFHRWNIKNKKNSPSWLGALDNVDKFDPLFFNLSPRTAEWMDPQQRLFLETSWHCFEDAGYPPSKLSNKKCGVFVGCMQGGYGQKIMQRSPSADSLQGGSTSILSARVAYFMNLVGPCLTIDTACSSSLVAIAEACNSLALGQSDMALTGGVYIEDGPEWHSMYTDSNMLSTDGRCFTFDHRANGFVAGEGVGCVLLKRLGDAERDGDTILGVIKGWGINQDGATNGITAPSANSQINLQQEVYDTFGINPEDIQLVEAHGTATPLGDPIEVEALTESFRLFTTKNNYCALSSVKSNIGHLVTAAGISGFIKLLMALKHRQLPPTINFEKLNPKISLEGSPFYINTKLQDWIVENGKRRCAAINSFGFSGTNAHLIIEEAPEQNNNKTQISKPYYLMPLSAKTEEALKQREKDLLVWFESQDNLEKIPLSSISYTLSVCRSHFNYRVAWVVKNNEELKVELELATQGKPSAQRYSGVVSKSQKPDDDAIYEEALKVLIAKLHRSNTQDSKQYRKNLCSIANLYMKGLSIDWECLHSNEVRISLPTYPFAKERFWVSEPDSQATLNNNKGVIQLHPLLHENTSDLSAQRFSSRFSGDEFFLIDHQIKGQRVLPGVAYLEMAREAIQRSSRVVEGRIIRLQDVVWLQPFIVNDASQTIHISLYEQNDQIEYMVYAQKGEETIVHSQGNSVFVPYSEDTLDIDNLRSQMNQGTIHAKQCYKAFDSMGLEYGSQHRGIQEIYQGQDQLLARLELGHMDNCYTIHPGMMDSSLQSAISLLAGNMNFKLNLPFALDSIEILIPTSTKMWAWVRYSNGSMLSDKVQKLDIDLCNQENKVCVKMRGFSSRELEGALGNPKLQPLVPDLYSFIPVWNSIDVYDKAESLLPDKKLLVLGGDQKTLKKIQECHRASYYFSLNSDITIDEFEKQFANWVFDHLLFFASGTSTSDTMITEQQNGVLQLFRIIKALLNVDFATKNLEWTVVTVNTQAVIQSDKVNPTHASIFGLVGALAKEYPHWKIRLLDLSSLSDFKLEHCLTLPFHSQGDGLAFRNKTWYQQKLVPVTLSHVDEQNLMYRKNGVYIVIGGAGGLGTVWTQYMIEHYQATVVWIGRRAIDETIKNKQNYLSKLGKKPLYIVADASNIDDLLSAYKTIKEMYPTIHGVVHSAITLQDQSLAKMSEEQFKVVLRAKVDISVNMDRVFGRESLDFILFFSSMISFAKGAGQSNYAAGCTFKDSFAYSLMQKHPYPIKIINWGFWGSTGIVANDFYQQKMQAISIASLEPEEAMQQLRQMMGTDCNQLSMMKMLSSQSLDFIETAEQIHYSHNQAPNILPQALASIIKRPLPDNITKEHKRSRDSGLDQLMLEILYTSLSNLGLFEQGKQRIADLNLTKTPAAFYESWLEESLRQLVKKQLIKADGTAIKSPKPLQILWEQWDNAKHDWQKNYNIKAQIPLIEVCLRALSDILTARCLATDIIFPHSSMQLVDQIYQDNPISDYFNQVLGDVLVASIKELLKQDQHTKVRILEIGAGTGGTTAVILPKISVFKEVIAEYCYTDLSKAFLMRAEADYLPQASYLTTAIFDVSKPIKGQAIQAGYFDFIIATNVLHATSNMRETLHNGKAALKKNGIILLNEISKKSLFAHITFGLLEGWWLSNDREALRIPGSPGLYPDTWQRLLAEEGFVDISFPVKAAHTLGQQIIVATSNGQVRQKVNQVSMASGLVQHTAIQKSLIDIGQSMDGSVNRNDLTNLRDTAVKYCKGLIAEVLKMRPEQIDESMPLENYGLDSILVTQLTNHFRKTFPKVTSTLFFEVSNIAGLVEYLFKEDPEVVTNLFVNAATSLSNDQPLMPRILTSSNTKIVRSRSNRSDWSRAALQLQADSRQETSLITDIAIIGMSGRYPQAENLNEFWHNLKLGKNCISEIPKDRWDWQKYFDSEKGKAGKMYSRWGGFLKDIDKFDPLFFNISLKEAEKIDPQERLFLQEAYHAIEDAGYTAKDLGENSKVGVFVGVMNATYSRQPAYFSIANRVSYFFNLHGPSMAVDTACSSSLTAIHLGVESLHRGESDIVIVGGVNLIVDPIQYLNLSSVNMLSSGDQCKPFGADSDGFVDGEGIGIILLKPLFKAQEDGDQIYGIIKGTSVNHGGKTNGYTVPNPIAQGELVKAALENAKIDPRTISYIEAHGTGTSLGDPIELRGLGKAFREQTQDKQFCSIGSVKSNIGHLESAAGVVAVTKVLLQLKYKQLVPSLHSERLNPNIDFERSPFYVQHELSDWNRPEIEENGKRQIYPRRAGISSFGAGGSNAHIIIEEAPEKRIATDTKPYHLITLSAKTEAAFKQRQVDFLAWLKTFEKGDSYLKTESLSAISYTLNMCRNHFNHRIAWVIKDKEELKAQLELSIEGHVSDQCFTGMVNNKKPDDDAIYEKVLQQILHELKSSNVGDDKQYYKNLRVLANLYVKGYSIDWELLYPGDEKQRISLPTYPFAKESYWVPALDLATVQLHPLVNSNISDLSEQSYEAQLQENAFYLTGYVIGDKIDEPLCNDSTLYYVLKKLMSTITEITKIPEDRIDVDADLEALGLDSIMISALNNKLAKWLGKLEATLFFKHKTLSSIAKFLSQTYADILVMEQKQAIESLSLQTNEQQKICALKNSASPVIFSRNLPLNQDIAIIGMSGKFPQANSLAEFWSNLREGKDCITEIPRKRFDYRSFFSSEKGKTNSIYCKWGGFLNDVEQFDALFFNISPQDARFMDPQERLFLESAWECLETAGYIQPYFQEEARNIGVFTGVTFNNYQLVMADAVRNASCYPVNSQIFSIANRVSYYFNFTGPSFTIDTACSSSLFAIHQACESLKRGECEVALAGGVNLSLHPSKYATLCAANFAASNGRCHAFADGGDGYVPSEAVGAVLLKLYQKALADCDPILAVIKGTGVSHDGKTQGYTVPNPVSQTKAIEAALKQANINPESINYVEAHGTGTALGDPIEIQGLVDAYEKYTDKKQYCAIGSVKSNIGHGEAAAGVSQLTKTILQMQHKILVPSLLHGNLNPNIDFKNSPFYVQEKETAWEQIIKEGKILPRRAGISSFGAGGVNVHIIVEEAPPKLQLAKQTKPGNETPTVIPFSAHLFSQLRELARALLSTLKEVNNAHYKLTDIAYVLQTKRALFRYRLAFLVSNKADLIEQLTKYVTHDEVKEKAYYEADIQSANNAFVSSHSKVEEGRLSALLRQGEMAELARLWVNGCPVPWFMLYPNDELYECLPLPNYPFSKKRYWITDIIEPNETEDFGSNDKNDTLFVSQDSKHPEDKKNEAIIAAASTAIYQLIGLSDIERKDKLEILIAEQLKSILGFSSTEEIDMKTGFFNLGMESIQAISMINTFQKEFGVAFPDTLLFEYSTIDQLVQYFMEKIPWDCLYSTNRSKASQVVISEAKDEAIQIALLESIANSSDVFKFNEPIPDDIEAMLDEEVELSLISLMNEVERVND